MYYTPFPFLFCDDSGAVIGKEFPGLAVSSWLYEAQHSWVLAPAIPRWWSAVKLPGVLESVL